METVFLVAKKLIIKSKPDTKANTPLAAPETIASVIYEQCAKDAFQLCRWLLPQQEAEDCLRLFASNLLLTVKKNNYSRYAKLLGFRTLFEILILAPNKVPLGLSFQEGVCLFLRDKLDFSCPEIASIMNCSEGSIRTRLLRTRHRLLQKAKAVETNNDDSNDSAPKDQTFHHKLESHLCIFRQEEIEDHALLTGAPLSDNMTEGCSDCASALQARKYLVQEMLRTPPHLLPKDLECFPVAPLFIRKGQQTLMNWTSAPWYLKVMLEGVLATALVLGIVFSLPRIKSVYELWIEKHIDLNSLADLATSLSHSSSDPTLDPSPIPQDTKLSAQAPNDYGPPLPTAAKLPTTTVTSEFSERDGATASSNKIYRIMIKTDAPDGIKTSVLKILNEYASTTINGGPGEGIELPGGIMFDIYVPLKNYKGALNELGRLGDTKVIITQSRAEILPGKAHLKIWLQRI